MQGTSPFNISDVSYTYNKNLLIFTSSVCYYLTIKKIYSPQSKSVTLVLIYIYDVIIALLRTSAVFLINFSDNTLSIYFEF